MNLKVGKKYTTKDFYALTHAKVLLGTPYEKDEITVVVEEIDLDGDYCMTIVDGDRYVINDNTGSFFYTNDEFISLSSTKFTEVKDD